jgi:redox-sensitive bicupin YhaK (pirin superfamily)
MKQIVHIERTDDAHWVGDGFPVRTLFSYHPHADAIDPFLLLDYAEPHEFGPAEKPRGVGAHPHKGFETVTIVLQGEVEHRDSAGSHGVIGPGDVQWMTAAAGLIHEEFHSHAFTQRGGTFEGCSCGSTCRRRTRVSAPATRICGRRPFPS